MERLTTAEAARRLRHHPNTLRAWLRQGRPDIVAAARRVEGGHHIRWDAAAIDAVGTRLGIPDDDGEVRSDG